MTNKFELVDHDDMEGADFMVCVPAPDGMPPVLPDNVFDFCCKCGQKVQHRPDAAVAPKRVCMECALPEMEKSSGKNDLHVILTRTQLKEIEAWKARKRGS